MSKIVVVTSGKGGVGKTTSSASIAAGIALLGYKTIVIDFDIGLRNLDLVMGCERRVVYDFVDVINGSANLNQALIRDKRINNLFILAASQTKDKDVLNINKIRIIFEELSKNFDYIICDSPAGIEFGAISALYFSDIAIIVTNPEISSVRDSDRMLGIISSKSYRSKYNLKKVKEYLLITRYSLKKVKIGDMLSYQDIYDMLSIPIIGIIPESSTILRSSNTGFPIILEKNNIAATAYKETVNNLLGKKIPVNQFSLLKKRNFFFRLFNKE